MARIANCYEVHEGAVESQNYVSKRLTKKECFKTLAEDGQRETGMIGCQMAVSCRGATQRLEMCVDRRL